MIKQQTLLYRPYKQRSKSAFTSNIFASSEKNQQIIDHSKNKPLKYYDFVGSSQFKTKMFFNSKNNDQTKKQRQQFQNANKTGMEFNRTINRQTILSKLNKQQITAATRQQRQLERYQEYQQQWKQEQSFIRKSLGKKSSILMKETVKQVYAHPNPDKKDVINDFIVNYWQMSLRNHHPILQRHIRGHSFGKIQKQQLLQLRKGIKKIEASIPSLPLQQLKRISKKDLSLSGRNKIKKEAQASLTSTERLSSYNSTRIAQEQVHKINYQGHQRWMGNQNL